MNELLKIAITAALDAGKEILKIYHSGEFGIKVKDDNSPLTKADNVSHKLITSHLLKTDIPILSEETNLIPFAERKDWNLLWLVDPIDGTKEFINRNIALIENQIPIMGVIFVPTTGELYYSSKEIGSFKLVINHDDFEFESILLKANKLPLIREDKTFTVVTSRSHMTAETEEYVQKMRDKHGKIKVISKGSSLKLCMVAEGLANCYPRFSPTMEWDTAAGQAICENVGSQVLDWETKKPVKYNTQKLFNSSFLVT